MENPKIGILLFESVNESQDRRRRAETSAINICTGFDLALTNERSNLFRFFPYHIKPVKVDLDKFHQNGYRDESLIYNPSTGWWQIGLAYPYHMNERQINGGLMVLVEFEIHFNGSIDHLILKDASGTTIAEHKNTDGHTHPRKFFGEVLNKLSEDKELQIRSLIRDRGKSIVHIKPFAALEPVNEMNLRECFDHLAKHLGDAQSAPGLSEAS